MRGNCGKASIFGQDLPCVDDGNATEVSYVFHTFDRRADCVDND
jgi:hypothetical protein